MNIKQEVEIASINTNISGNNGSNTNNVISNSNAKKNNTSKLIPTKLPANKK